MSSHDHTAYNHVYLHSKKNNIKVWFYTLLGFCIFIAFLPWTQNIRTTGQVTTLRQEERSQQINTIIGGKIQKWHVKEGDYVRKGDTIVELSEIKEEYLDPNLLQRTREQIVSKESAVEYYKNKIGTAESQVDALTGALKTKLNQLSIKLRQAELKIMSDSMEMVAALNDWKIATVQFNRQKLLYDSGLVSLTQLEARNQSFQSALAKKVGAENKYYATTQEKNIVQAELAATQLEYAEKISKAESDKFGSLSMVATGQGEIAKLQNQYASYSIRNGLYYVIAPQSGQIIGAVKSGVGEIVKEGEMLVHIVPDQRDFAIELYVRPVDVPLISPGQKFRFIFDGFPAIVFSGWPDASYGTYAGIVSAVENDVSGNGKFRILVRQDSSYRKWPRELRMGTGAQGIALLKNVPVWYELWRNINSFPPDYYKPNQAGEKK